MPITSILTIIGSILAVALAIAGVAAMAGLAYSQFTSGKTKGSTEKIATENLLLDNYEKQLKGFKDTVEQMRADLKISQDENLKLKTINEQLIKVNEQYLAILQDKDPATKQFMELMIQNATDQLDYRKKTMVMFESMTKVLSDIHSVSIESRDLSNLNHEELGREIKVESSITKQ